MLRHLFVLRLLHTECAWATTIAAWPQRVPSDVTFALQQKPRGVAPPGDGTSSAVPRNAHVSKCVPPLDARNASHSHEEKSEVPAALSGFPMQTIIERKRNAGVKLCMSIDGYLRGGLANSMGVVNMAMDYAIRNGLNFIMPEILPIDHDLGDDFSFMFGSNPVCATRTVSVWPATCHSSSLMGKRPPAIELPTNGGCNVSKQYVHTAHRDTTSVCDCDEFILVGTAQMTWSYDYSRTATKLSRMYWRNAPGTHSHTDALKFPLRTVMHLRLGDVEGMESSKALGSEEYGQLVMALTSFINVACLDVSILTDGEASDKNVLATERFWSRAGAKNIRVLDIATPANESLNTMARADVLIGGPSGFPRLAAVLGNAQVKLFINDCQNSHPIEYLPGVSGVSYHDIHKISVKLAARKALVQNDRVAKVAAACTRYLARKRSSS